MPKSALPQIAIVGRPNVGKSSLLNRLAGRRVSIVDPTPGVTRDRVSAVVEIAPPTETPHGTPFRSAEFIDTGGYGVYTADGQRYDDVGADLTTLTDDIELQIRSAIDRAMCVVFVLDAQAGITALDRTFAAMIREAGCATKTLLVSNKVDDESWMPHALDATSLGLGEPMGVSAANGFSCRALREKLYGLICDSASEHERGSEEIKLAIVGKRNSGKSTLINAWAGEERVIVSEIAGTTRDSIDVRFEIEGRQLLAIDTAGVRKRKSFAGDVEFYAHTRMNAAIRRADVVVLLLDATAEISQVDKKLALEMQKQFKPTVIAVNKWDLVDPKRHTTESFLKYITQQLKGLDFAPIVFLSAIKGENLRDLAAMAFNLSEQATHRETTAPLNDIVQGIVAKRGPSSSLGTRAKVLYASQVSTAPPTIVLVVNKPELFHGQYERYLLNELREALPYSEVPIRLLFRERTRMPLAELKSRGSEARSRT